MNKVTVYFTTRKFNLFSWLIRWLVPRSQFALSRASHAIIIHENDAWQAEMIGGVQKIPIYTALSQSTIIEIRQFNVPDAAKGLAFGLAQLGKSYDWGAAFGLAIAPDRLWQQDDKWDCIEFVAAWIQAAGRKIFRDTGRVTVEMLMAIDE